MIVSEISSDDAKKDTNTKAPDPPSTLHVTADMNPDTYKELIISTANMLENIEFFTKRTTMPPMVTNMLENLFTLERDVGLLEGKGNSTAPLRTSSAMLSIFAAELLLPSLFMTVVLVSSKGVSFFPKLGIFCLLLFNIALVLWRRPVPTR